MVAYDLPVSFFVLPEPRSFIYVIIRFLRPYILLVETLKQKDKERKKEDQNNIRK